MKRDFLCPLCLAADAPEQRNRWRLLAHMVLDACSQGDSLPTYQEGLLAVYLQQAYEKGVAETKAKIVGENRR